MTPSTNKRVLQRRKLLNTAKLPDHRCHMRPTSRSDDSMVTGVGSQTTTDDVLSFSRIDCETREERVLSLPVFIIPVESPTRTKAKWNANKTIEQYLSYSCWKRETSLSSVGLAFAAQTSAEVAWGTAVMELQSWLLYHLVAVTDCNQGNSGLPMFDVMQSATTLNGGSYPAGGTGSRARDLGLRAQKKLLGRVVSTGAGRSLLIDDATTSLLDNLYKLMERAAKTNSNLDKKQPEKVLKNIVKLSIKVGLLQRNQQLNAADDAKLVEIRTALRAVAMSVVSFYELEFSFDRAYLIKSLERCRTAIQALIKPHLTDKSQDRCDQVFDFLTHSDFLDSVFRQDSEHRSILGMLVSDINKALDAGHL